jgi:transposase-like protein
MLCCIFAHVVVFCFAKQTYNIGAKPCGSSPFLLIFCRSVVIIYTTNTIENLNRGIRKYTKTKTQFPNENAAAKSIYLAIKNIEQAWNAPIANWGLILNQYLIIFEDRCRH